MPKVTRKEAPLLWALQDAQDELSELRREQNGVADPALKEKMDKARGRVSAAAHAIDNKTSSKE